MGVRAAGPTRSLPAYLVEAEMPGGRPPFGLRDASHKKVVDSAISAPAELIVTGDRGICDIELPLHVVTPRGLWELLRTSR